MAFPFVDKIEKAESVLIALSKNPSVDDIATAIALSIFVEKMGKNVTTIYSGKMPNFLEFLKPEERISSEVSGLQDFIIAINKDKADHLRYKLDGELVKVFITPYKSKITESDLEFSYGEFNVDLVVLVNVKAENELDEALKEYGKVLREAEMVAIEQSANGNVFGAEKWLLSGESSLSEMVGAELVASAGEIVDADVATALLTGIIAETNRFSNEKTTPEAMNLAAKLMKLGANQQLISAKFMEKMVPAGGEMMEEAESGDIKPLDATSFEVPRGENVGAGVENVVKNTTETMPPVKNDGTEGKTFSEVELPQVVEPVEDSVSAGNGKNGEKNIENGVGNVENGVGNVVKNTTETMPMVAETSEVRANETGVEMPKLAASSPVVEEIIKKNENALKTRGFAGVNYGGVIDQALEMGTGEDSGDAGGYIGGNPALKKEEKETETTEGGYIGGNPALFATPQLETSTNENVNMPGLGFETPVNALKDPVLPLPPMDGANAPVLPVTPFVVEKEPENNVIVQPMQSVQITPSAPAMPDVQAMPSVSSNVPNVAEGTNTLPPTSADPGAFRIPNM